jgi:hypothetical protein
LLQRFAATAGAHLRPPPDGAFMARDYHLQIDRVRPLLGLQQSHVISVGE